MTPEPVWTETFQINHVEGDYYRKWRLSCLFMALQEVAAHHAINLGAGYDELQAQRLAWVLSRFKIRFDSFPFAGERVTIQTWPKGVQGKLFFLRDFLISNENGSQVYARASSAWLLTDTRTRGVQRASALALDIPHNAGRHALDEPLERIATQHDLQERFQVEAHPSMLDLMGHVTSSRYLEWVVDCFPVEAYQDDGLAWLQINFNQEVRPGEQVSVRSGVTPLTGKADLTVEVQLRGQAGQKGSSWCVQGINLNNNGNAFEAALGFRDTNF